MQMTSVSQEGYKTRKGGDTMALVKVIAVGLGEEMTETRELGNFNFEVIPRHADNVLFEGKEYVVNQTLYNLDSDSITLIVNVNLDTPVYGNLYPPQS